MACADCASTAPLWRPPSRHAAPPSYARRRPAAPSPIAAPQSRSGKGRPLGLGSCTVGGASASRSAPGVTPPQVRRRLAGARGWANYEEEVLTALEKKKGGREGGGLSSAPSFSFALPTEGDEAHGGPTAPLETAQLPTTRNSQTHIAVGSAAPAAAPMTALLAHPVCVELLKAELQAIHSVENLVFYLCHFVLEHLPLSALVGQGQEGEGGRGRVPPRAIPPPPECLWRCTHRVRGQYSIACCLLRAPLQRLPSRTSVLTLHVSREVLLGEASDRRHQRPRRGASTARPSLPVPVSCLLSPCADCRAGGGRWRTGTRCP